MSLAVTSAREWNISVRTRGEALTAAARAPGCELLLLGVPRSYTPPEVEGWLGDLIGVARETSRNDLQPRPIPALLHHALTGLLFSHEQVWISPGNPPPCSLAFVRTESDLAFGWVGEGAPGLWIDGRQVEPMWVRVRDGEGREACAFSVDVVHRVRVTVEWSDHSGSPDAAVAEVEAEWPGTERLIEQTAPEAAAPPADPAGAPDASQGEAASLAGWHSEMASVAHPGAAEPPSSHEPPDPEQGPSTFLGWIDRVMTRPRESEPAAAPASGPESAEAPPAASVAAPAGGAPEAAEVDTTTGGEVAESATLPELIPPTPEPPALTAAATGGAPEAPEAPFLEAPAVIVATAEEPLAPAPGARPSRRSRPPLHPAWPSERELAEERPRRVKAWVWALGGVALLAVAVVAGVRLLGTRGDAAGGIKQALGGLALGGPTFEIAVNSTPPGAWIAADGKDLAKRTPATIQLPPGEHRITLTYSDLGATNYMVRGARGDHQSVEAPLWGTLSVQTADPSTPITVEFDGDKVGYAPVTIDSVAPGAHDVRFQAPGMATWGEALRVKVGEHAEVIARPMTSPATGMLQVRATLTGDGGAQPLEGATVWLDGERRGATPLTLELPRGPHSVRVEYRGEQAPIQVIDLPGGNQRFATFELGLNLDRPKLVASGGGAPLPLDQPTTISGNLDGLTLPEVREMWLNVREPDGPWRRYQMVMLKSPAGVVGVAVFPTALFDPHGKARYYLSASTQTGDDYYTEMLTASAATVPTATPR